jgi:transposase
MKNCPHCQNEDQQVKAGKTRTGSQRYKCKPCNRRYTPNPKERGYPEEVRQEAVWLVDGQNFRRIGRQLAVDHKSVMNWVKAHVARLEDAPVPDDVNHAEMDELFTFIGSKRQNLSDEDSR